MQGKATQKIHEAYLICRDIFSSDLTFLEEYTSIEDKEEKMFYELLDEFFMQQRQRTAIEKGVC